MNHLQALILGLVQGITEFFPVSSSAHLKIAKKLLGVPDGEHLLYFDLLCHVGTLFALILFLRHDLTKTLRDKKKQLLIFLALLPLIPGYFFLKPIRIALSSPSYVGYFLLATAFLLWIAGKKSTPPFAPQKKRHAFWVGTMQTLALLPGISRSGSTVAAARLCGWSWQEGAKFSFLLAVPTIIGGEILETIKHLLHPSPINSLNHLPWSCYMVGGGASFLVGLFSVRIVFKIYEGEKVGYFAIYCLIAGLLALALFHG